MAPKLEEHRDLAYLSYQLATIKTDVPLPLGISELHNEAPDLNLLGDLFADMEFKAWTTELSQARH